MVAVMAGRLPKAIPLRENIQLEAAKDGLAKTLELPAVAATDAAPAATGGLNLVRVSVDAPDGRVVVSEASLALAQGEHVATMGASGVGKSTLLEAIAGLRDYRGEIVEGGQLGVIGQRPTIFAGSIADNIRLGRRNACHAAVRLAAQRAHVTDFADELPEGLATQLGETGLGLSGGEIHRVALARLYLRDPDVLLLDEPTAHLDAVTEAAVLDDLLEFAQGRTMIVVTHSAAVAARMGRCYRLVDGRLLPAVRPRIDLAKTRSAA